VTAEGASVDRYHVRRKDRAITDQVQLDELLAQGRFVTIGFALGDEPYVVTLSYGYDPAPSRLYFHTAKEGLKIELIEANPEVCATVVIDRGYVAGACEHEYASVVLRGRMSMVDDVDECRAGMDVLLRHLETPDAAMALSLRHHLDGEAAYRRMAVLRLDVSSMMGKAGR